ncbi:hypothetical protein KY289_021662 [Solanum tuberosum]|nr:hypothetical protein KY289_021662 [Solanum tuberosum]
MSAFGSSSQVFVYDSLVHSWSQFGGFDLILNENHHQEGVFHDGYLWFITPEPYFTVCMDLDNGVWKRSNFELPSEVTFARLVCDGDKKMFLVSGNGSNGISRSMKLWELNGDSKIWVEVENVSRRTWHWLPKCPSLPDKWSCGFRCGRTAPPFIRGLRFELWALDIGWGKKLKLVLEVEIVYF